MHGLSPFKWASKRSLMSPLPMYTALLLTKRSGSGNLNRGISGIAA